MTSDVHTDELAQSRALNSGHQNAAEVRRITWIGLIGNVAISALKFVVGIIGASQAVVADAVHSLSDMTTDIAILLGVRYGRVETEVFSFLG